MRFIFIDRREQSEIVLVAALIVGSVMSVAQQQPACPPGSPCATTTIDGKQLPAPPFKFEGKIERNAPQSKPYWPPRIVQPKGAPNVLLIMTDDSVRRYQHFRWRHSYTRA